MVGSEDQPVDRKLISVATELFRRNGYIGTSVEEICSAAGVTKGAFFHYFKSKETLAQACLERWKQMAKRMVQDAPFHSVADPVERLHAGLTFLTDFFSQPGMLKSCLAGTTLQETSESHPRLKQAAHECLVDGQSRFASLLESAAKATGTQADPSTLAALWMATLQGSYILAKGSGDDSVVRQSLEHVNQYITSLIMTKPE